MLINLTEWLQYPKSRDAFASINNILHDNSERVKQQQEGECMPWGEDKTVGACNEGDS